MCIGSLTMTRAWTVLDEVSEHIILLLFYAAAAT